MKSRFSVVLVSLVAFAAAYAQAPPPSGPNEPPPAQLLSPQQLDDLVAPIALYPDPLLSQVLVASTYPLEVVEAQQWQQKNTGLSGQALMDAAKQQNWDPSVQALVAMPNVLSLLNQDVQWTTALGNAFLAQQSDVMAAVQRMRARAQANGKLRSTPQETVTTATDNGQAAIEIQPANPEVIYVPEYDPAYVWGPPVYGYYPALYYPAFGFGYWPGLNISLCFGGWGYGGWGGWGGWGWGPNWFGGGVYVNHAFFRNYGFRGYGYGGFAGRGAWIHDPGHRLGVAYPTRSLSQRWGAASRASAARMGSSFVSRGGSFQGMNRGGFQGVNRGSTFQGGNRGSFQGANRGFQGSQGFRGTTPQNNFRSTAPSNNFRGFQGSANRSFQSAPRSFQSAPRSFQSAPRSFSAPSRSFSAPSRSFSAPSRSFSAPSAGRSFGGGGGGRSFGGGGGHSFTGGGHSGGGGGHRGR